MAEKLKEKDILLEKEQKAVQTTRVTLEQTLTSLQAEYAKCVEKQVLTENNMTTRNKKMESTIRHLQEDLIKTAKERDDLLDKKETLVQEQIKILKEMAEDREEMKAELEQYQVNLNAMKTTLEAEKERNKNLEDQLASLKQEQLHLDDTTTTLQQQKDEKRPLEGQLVSLEHQQNSHNQMEETISELSSRKHEMVNEKEELEMKVKRLESELKSFMATRSENKQLRMVVTIMETKLKKVNSEFSSCSIRQQQMESQLKQAKTVLGQHAEEFAQAIKCRDTAITEMITMKGQMDAMRERELQVMTVRRPENEWQDIPELETSNFNELTSEIEPLALYLERSLEINSILQKIL